ncbi:MAG TPA: SBBP repeat-containing protein [Verrucomicrobiae bacterium]|nr:SBBP repeat-containing protein [Verrucomicrobiae bacterium]
MKPQSASQIGFREGTLRITLLLMFVWGGALISLAATSSLPGTGLTVSGQLPICFEANHGQVEVPVKFIARGPAYYFSLAPTEATVSLRKFGSAPAGKSAKNRRGPTEAPMEFRSVRLEFLGANPGAATTGESELAGRVNYFLGSDATNWRTGVPLFERVRVKEMYPGIDLVHYGNEHFLEYDFEVAPGADPGAIAVRFSGADAIAISREGELVIKLGEDEIRQPKPVIYQNVDGVRKPIAGGYVLTDARTVKFSWDDYDRRLPLVIDPVLSYSSFYGGSGKDSAWGVVVTADGSIYVAGETMAGLPITSGAATNRYNGGTSAHGDAFVAKFDNSGTNVIYRSYIGGSLDDVALALAVDADGNAYITGWTDSSNFPRTNAIFNQIKGTPYPPPVSIFPAEAFVTKLGPLGTNLIYSTYLGSSGIDVGNGIAVDANGNTYVAGYTQSTNFPTANVFGSFTHYSGGFQDDDGFVTKIGPAGTNLIYSMYLGGTNLDRATDIAVDAAGLAYVTGFTSSTNFPVTTNATQQWLGGDYDAFVTVIGAFGSNLVTSTYIGGPGTNRAERLALDGALNVYVTGATYGDPAYPISPSALNPGGVFRSSDGASSWNSASAGLQSVEVLSLAMNPANPSQVYAGTTRGIARSVDGGLNWSTSISVAPMARIASQGPAIAIGSVLAIAVDPLQPATVYAGTAQGVFKSTDAGASWFLNNKNLNISSTRTLAIDPVNPGVLYSAGDAGVYRSTDGGTNWLSANSGLGNLTVRALVIDLQSPSTLYAATAGGVYRSVNFSTNWSAINSGLGSVSAQALVINPVTPDILYVGTAAGVFTSTNGGSNWISASGGLTTSNVTALAINPFNPTILYAGTTSGVFKSEDAGVSWAAQSDGIAVGDIRAVAVNPQSPEILYAGTRGESFFGGADVFVTKLGLNGFSAVFGGTGSEEGGDVVVGPSGNVHVVGTTTSQDFPTLFTAGLLRATNSGGRDVFLSRLSDDGGALVSSVYIGGAGDDWGNAIAVDADENVYIVGETKSVKFPTLNALQGANRGSSDAFLSTIANVFINPSLRIQPFGSEVQLTWNALASDYPLQSTTNLQTTAAWENVGVSPVESNGVLSVFLPATNAVQFFRLVAP